MVQGVNLNNVKEINSGSLLSSNASIQLIFAQLQMDVILRPIQKHIPMR